jgi:predicted N-acetyltransferase YhbS
MPSSVAVAPLDILPEAAEHAAAIEALYDEAFGPGRFAKAAERLREENVAIPEASLVAMDALGLTGVVRLWPVTAGGAPGLALLGPLAVAERRRGDGVAFRLMEQAIEACARLGYKAVVLVGDEAYYRRAGFQKAGVGRFQLPGPVDQNRVLIRNLAPEADALKGMLAAPRAMSR